MKKTAFITLAICAMTLVSSCGKHSSAYKNLQAKYDSLEMVSRTTESNLEEMLTVINEVEQSFEEIRAAENFVAIKHKSGELTASTREQIKNNMQLVASTLKENREKIELLNEQLKKNSAAAKLLGSKIKRMTDEIQRKESELVALRNELAMRDVKIEQLDSALVRSAQNVDVLAQENAAQQAAIAQQDAALNAVFYCFGTSSELKEHKILIGGSIFSSPKVLAEGFNKDYFIKMDRRELHTIPLFEKKAVLHTKHPASSYSLDKGSDGNLTLNIKNTKEFWSLSQYLVIEVK